MELMTTSELREKQIINVCNGEQLGYACDFQFDKCSATISGIIIEKNNGFLGLCAGDTLFIPWCKIECIGEDTILVRFDEKEGPTHCEHKRKKRIWDFK